MSFRKFWMIFIIIFALSACVSASPRTSADGSRTGLPITKIRLPMGYIPSVQFAPFYVASENGYYQAEGLDIEFDYSMETDAVALVGHESLPFAVVSGEQVLLARAQGLPVVYVMNYYKDYPVALVSKVKSGIKSPADLVGKHIGVPCLCGASYIGTRALLNAAGLDESQVFLEVVGYNQVESLTLDRQDVVVCYSNNEPIQFKAQNVDVNVISVSDYVQLASNGLITNETVLKNNPELVQRMIRATARGIRSSIENPKQAYEISKKYVENLSTLDPQQEKIQKEVLRVSVDLWRNDPVGKSNPQAWENMQKVLLEMGLLTKKQDVNRAYTNDFIH